MTATLITLYLAAAIAPAALLLARETRRREWQPPHGPWCVMACCAGRES